MADQDSKIPYGFCQCGCGSKTSIARQNHAKYGWKKGEPLKYIKYHHNLYHGKWYKNTYINGVTKAEHITRAEKALGKPLPFNAVVHHVTGKKDRGPLVICQNEAYHKLLHQRMRALKSSGHASWRKCQYCKNYDDPKFLSFEKAKTYHPACDREYKNRRRHSSP